MTDTVTQPPRGGTIGALVLAVAAAVVWALAMLKSLAEGVAPMDDAGNHAGAAAFIVGYSLIPALVVWAVLFFAWVRRRAPGRGPLYLAIIFAAVLGANIALVSLLRHASGNDDAQARTASREVAAALGAAMKAPNSAQVDTRPKATGGAGKIEGHTKAFLAQMLADRRAYTAELAALGFPQFLEPRQVAGDRHLVATRAKLQQIRAVVARYRALSPRRVEEFRAGIEGSDISESVKRAFLTGFDRTAGASKAQMDRTWALEDAIVGEYDAAVEVLAKSEGRWRVEGAMYRFSRGSDLAAWQAHMDKADALYVEQQAVQQAGAATAQEGIRRLEQAGD